MKKAVYLVSLFVLTFVLSCSKPPLSGEELEQYNSTLEKVEEVENLITELEESAESVTFNAKHIRKLITISESLRYTAPTIEMDTASERACKELQKRCISLEKNINKFAKNNLHRTYVEIVNEEDIILEKKTVYPVYLLRGEKLHIDVKTKNPISLKIYNYNTRTTIKNIKNQRGISYIMDVENGAIYLIELTPTSAQYTDIKVSYTAKSFDRFYPTKVKERTVDAVASDYGAWSTKGIKLEPIFDEPRKFTLRGQLKAAFSGSFRGIVPVQIPAGTTDILYRMRISTNEADSSSDGEFNEDMNYSYKQIKMLGLPIYESSKSTGILNTILGEYTPLREEDAYINMYVFNSGVHAKKFNDRQTNGNIIYDIDHSIMGMQSSNGRIPVKGKKTIYLGFENERTRYNNYVWVEVLASKPITEYFKTEYYID